MESTLQIMPVQRTSRNFGEFAEDATIVVEEPVVKSSVSFLDANTNPVTLEELTTQCVVSYMANQELTIAHQDFISCVHDAASSFYMLQHSMTASSRTDPPGSAMYSTPLLCARSMLSLNGKKASEPKVTPFIWSSHARFSSLVKTSGFTLKIFSHAPSARTSMYSSPM